MRQDTRKHNTRDQSALKQDTEKQETGKMPNQSMLEQGLGQHQGLGRHEKKVRRMQTRTWSRSYVNDAGMTVSGPDPGSFPGNTAIPASERIIQEQGPDKVPMKEDAAGFFLPREAGAFLDQYANRRHYLRIPRGYTEKDPIVLDLHLTGENPDLVDDVVIEAEEDSQVTVLINYTSEEGQKVHHYGRTRILAHRNAHVKLVKAQVLGEMAVHTDSIGGIAEEGARLDVVLAEIGARNPFSSCNLVLKGEGSEAELDAVYLGDGQRSLDMSYRVEHRGKKTLSRITAKGVLLERCRKTFRDTLDFISGAAGSRGREEENVLMLSPDVRNLSAPVMLCGEENVEGDHALSSGRLDEKILFYLMSRGLSEVEAKKLLAEAAVSSVVEKIPEESIQNRIKDQVRKAIEKGGQTA